MHRHRPPSARALITGLIAALTSCASLEIDSDLDRAQSLVGSRTGIKTNWEAPPEPIPNVDLTADDVARLALSRNVQLRSAIEAIAQARANLVQAHLLPNPVLNVVLGFGADGAGGAPTMGTLLQPLTALWERPARIDSAEHRLRAAVLQVSAAAIRLRARAAAAHANVVFASQKLLLETRSCELSRDSLRLVERRLELGEATGLDRDQRELEVLAAENRIVSATTERDAALRELAELLGSAETFRLPTLAEKTVGIVERARKLSEPDVIQLAESQRLDLAIARTLASGTLDEVRLAELHRLPQLSLGSAFSENFQGRRAWGPALGLELPLFDDGRAEVARAESMARQAAAVVEQTRQRVIREVRQAWVGLHGSLEKRDRLEQSVLVLARQNRERAVQSFEAGVVDRLAVLESSRRETAAQLDVLEAEHAAVIWHVELEVAVGGRIALKAAE